MKATRPVTTIYLITLFLVMTWTASASTVQELAITTDDSIAAPAAIQFEQSFDPFGTLFKTIALVLFLSFALYLGLRIYRGYLQAKDAGKQTQRVKVLSSSLVAPRKTVCIMQALDHVLVVGMTDNHMNVLLDVPLSELSDEFKTALFQNKAVSDQRFSQFLNQWMKRQE